MNIPTWFRFGLAHKLKPGAREGKHEFIWSEKAKELRLGLTLIWLCTKPSCLLPSDSGSQSVMFHSSFGPFFFFFTENMILSLNHTQVNWFICNVHAYIKRHVRMRLCGLTSVSHTRVYKLRINKHNNTSNLPKTPVYSCHRPLHQNSSSPLVKSLLSTLFAERWKL